MMSEGREKGKGGGREMMEKMRGNCELCEGIV